jgi:hypothetical protein
VGANDDKLLEVIDGFERRAGIGDIIASKRFELNEIRIEDGVEVIFFV